MIGDREGDREIKTKKVTGTQEWTIYTIPILLWHWTLTTKIMQVMQSLSVIVHLPLPFQPICWIVTGKRAAFVIVIIVVFQHYNSFFYREK